MSNRRKGANVIVILSIIIITLFCVDVYVGSKYDISPGVFVSGFYPTDTIYETGELVTDSFGANRLGKRYWKENGIYINNEGFRSEDFVLPAARDSGEVVIMFLGDSHTFGWDADPLSKAFPDLVRDAGFVSYNTGISGTDPAQYLALAQQLIPKYKPDVCYVMYCEDNDEQSFERQVSSKHPPNYATNLGWLSGHKYFFMPGYEGPPFNSLDDAYDFYLKNYTLLYEGTSFTQKIIAKSNFLTLIYKEKFWTDPAFPVTWPKPKAGKYLKKIKEICDGYQVKFRIVVISNPATITNDKQAVKERTNGVFDSLEIGMPPDLKESDYGEGSHFNNSGHRKMADYLVKDIDSLLRSDP